MFCTFKFFVVKDVISDARSQNKQENRNKSKQPIIPNTTPKIWSNTRQTHGIYTQDNRYVVKDVKLVIIAVALVVWPRRRSELKNKPIQLAFFLKQVRISNVCEVW